MFVATTLLMVVLTLSGELVSAKPQYLFPRYQRQPYYPSGRQIFPFNLLNDFFTNKFYPAAENIKTLQASLNALTLKVEEDKPKCPSTATGSHLIENHCYSLETHAATFLDAQVFCQNKGGILAEPPVSKRVAWFTKIRYTFITIPTVWIGLRKLVGSEAADPFYFVTSHSMVDSDSGLIFAAAPVNAAHQGVTIAGTTESHLTRSTSADAHAPESAADHGDTHESTIGSLWTRSPLTDAHAYLCQYPII